MQMALRAHGRLFCLSQQSNYPMHTTPELSLVTTTVATMADARRLAQAVLQARLAACVQVLSITSHYRWKGALHDGPEQRLDCKTTAQAVPALLALLRALHPYDLPELVVQPLQSSTAYAQWVVQEVAQESMQEEGGAAAPGEV